MVTRTETMSSQDLKAATRRAIDKYMANSERPTMSIPEFAEAFGCSRNLAFRLARQNKLPVPVIFIGEKRMCVSRKAVLALLEGKDNETPKL